MSKVILTGPTGMVGSGILAVALASPLISTVTVLSRRAPPIKHPKLRTIILPSTAYPLGFEEIPPSLVDQVKDHTAIIWAQGISQMQVKEEEYIKVTYDYPMAAARAFASLGTPARPFKFIQITAELINQDESGRQINSRIKGRAEKHLHAMDSDSFKTVSLRPGGIIPTPEHEKTMSALYRYAANPFVRVLDHIMPSMVTRSTEIGVVAVELAAGTRGWDKLTEQGWIGNTVMRAMAKEYCS